MNGHNIFGVRTSELHILIKIDYVRKTERVALRAKSQVIFPLPTYVDLILYHIILIYDM